MRVLLRYDANRRPVWSENEPARARVSGYGQGNTHDLTLIGGSHIQGESSRDRELRMQREAMRKQREKR